MRLLTQDQRPLGLVARTKGDKTLQQCCSVSLVDLDTMTVCSHEVGLTARMVANWLIGSTGQENENGEAQVVT